MIETKRKQLNNLRYLIYAALGASTIICSTAQAEKSSENKNLINIFCTNVEGHLWSPSREERQTRNADFGLTINTESLQVETWDGDIYDNLVITDSEFVWKKVTEGQSDKHTLNRKSGRYKKEHDNFKYGDSLFFATCAKTDKKPEAKF